MIDPDTGTHQSDIFHYYKIALLKTTPPWTTPPDIKNAWTLSREHTDRMIDIYI